MRAYARSAPSALSPKIEPQISFAQHKTAWVDITKQTVLSHSSIFPFVFFFESVAGEKWAPLVDFMATWGQGGWGGQTAWIQMTQDGKDAYRDLQLSMNLIFRLAQFSCCEKFIPLHASTLLMTWQRYSRVQRTLT